MKNKIQSISFLGVMILISLQAYAGGPLVSVKGRPVVYPINRFPIPFSPDQGPLGSFTNAEATSLVESCFQTWQDVPTATIEFQNDGQMPVDINADNYASYADNFYDDINPIIFDSDGSIIDVEYGSGASDSVIGFAGSAYNAIDGGFVEGLAVLNGKFSSFFTYDQFKASFVHEFGHFMGLDHTQINLQYVRDGKTTNDQYVPTMFPTATDDDTSLGDLNPDDQAALTLLYPDANAYSFYGSITGSVTRDNGQPVLGANVVAVKVGDEDMSQFSSISDYYQQNDGSYEMLVTPGIYTLFIEPVNEQFTGGSSVGPYAIDLNQPSFSNPVTKEYYNGSDESANEVDLSAYVEVSVSSGQIISDIDFIAEGLSSSTIASTIPATTTTTSVPETTTSTTITTETTSTIPERITVDFEGNPTSGPAPLTVEWKNLSEGSIQSYLWDFGDGTTSNKKNTFHTYTRMGKYSVTLTVTGTDGNTETEEKTNYISVYPGCPLRTTLENREYLLTLRRLRDKSLNNFLGKIITSIYYRHSSEVAAILSENPRLQEQLRQQVKENIAIAEEWIVNGKTTLPATNLANLLLLLNEIKESSGWPLRFYSHLIIQGIQTEFLLNGMGVSVD